MGLTGTVQGTPGAETKAAGLSNAEVLNNLAVAKSAQKLDEALDWSHDEILLEIPSFDAVADGKPAYTALLEVFFSIFPDYSVTLDALWEHEDGRISVFGKIGATLSGDFQGHTPNGKHVAVPVFMLFDFRDEQVSYEHFLFDFGTICRTADVPLEAAVAEIKSRWKA